MNRLQNGSANELGEIDAEYHAKKSFFLKVIKV